MGRYKPDLTWVSISQLAELTGKATATIASLLKQASLDCKVDGGAKLYVPRMALPILFGGVALDPQKERAKLDIARRAMVELQMDEKRGVYFLRADVESIGAGIMSATAQRVTALRNMMPEIRATGSNAEAIQIFDKACNEALSELFRLGNLSAELDRNRRRGRRSLADSVETTPDSDGEPVGGHGEEAEP